MSDTGVLCGGGLRGSTNSSDELVNAASRLSVADKDDGSDGVVSINNGYSDLCVCKL